MTNKQQLGIRIQELRKNLNLTQQELGEKCELSYKYLGNIERGRENPTFETLLKISKGLEIETWSLFIFDHLNEKPEKLINEINKLASSADSSLLKMILKILRTHIY